MSWYQWAFSGVSDLVSFLSSLIRFFNLFIFDFLLIFLIELLAISDSAACPRVGMRRGELWSRIAFKISKEPAQLIAELERMSRGKSE